MSSDRRWPLPRAGVKRAWWLREALATERMTGGTLPAPPLRGQEIADVAIVGGGYTGMWTAYFLTERDPGMRIVIVEQDICGGGPSGRNGGFVHGWWEQLPYLVKRYGSEAGLEIAAAADEVVDGIGAWCEEHGVDAWYRKAGYLAAHAFPAVDSGFAKSVEAVTRLGGAGQLVTWDASRVQRVCASPAFRDGQFMPSAASIQPARLARGLRRVLLERGVVIHENTHVRRVETHSGSGGPGHQSVRVTSDHGSVLAHEAVLAVNAWAAGWPGHRLRVLAWGSYMVITEPIPARLAALGWTGGELISDTRFTISYFRTTRDGRIAFGAGVGAAGFDGRIGRTFDRDQRAVGRVAANFDHLFPMLRDVRFEDAWGGPIDITADRFPVIGSREGGRVHHAYGFSGNGAGPARLAGRILAALVDDPHDPLARLPLVNRRQRILPPEPFRFIGARVIREALIRRDDALDAGRRPGLAVRALARVPGLLGYRFEH
ncbi:MAG TPA: FAD-binding oxidoreductase [Candidatus Limnocylindria bacterium]|nr:FAD-binding oxidoreductase [Candidatus Limnocylindria bacterium]